jgi:hypothetical protein
MAGVVRRLRREPTLGGSASQVSRNHNMGRKNPEAVERKLGMKSFPPLHGRRATI